MIEVIKHGKSKEKITTRCPKCECIFSFIMDEDTSYDEFMTRDYITCPDCGEEITVKHDNSNHLDCEVLGKNELNN